MQAIAIDLCHLLELEDKTPLLKTTHAWNIGLRGIDVELIGGPSLWKSFYSMGGYFFL